MLQQTIKTKFLRAMDGLAHGQLRLTTPEGQNYHFGANDNGPLAKLELHDWSVVRNLVLNGDIGFADDYRHGKWSTDDLPQLISLALKNENLTNKYIDGGFSAYILGRIASFLNRNTLRGSQRNIRAHYDLGNDFYSAWLDPSMTYSSAVFAQPGQDLQDAQMAKYDRILNKIGHSGKVLEIGCGWGGFIERARQKGDFSITGLTLSPSQKSWAERRTGSADQVVLRDYRAETGLYDRIVSIEMFEAVGEEYWDAYFQKIAACLKKNGNAVVQTITIADDRFEKYRKNGDFIRQFIFPGGLLPSPKEFCRRAEKSGLRVIEKFEFASSYALTLRRWLDRFMSQESVVRAMGYDDKFIRLWKFYLAACIAGFETGRTNVMQAELVHA